MNGPDAIAALLREGVDTGLFTGASFWRARGGDTLAMHAGESRPASLFDLASLTKPIVTTVAMRAVAEGVLELDEPAGGATLAALLGHRAGYPAHVDLARVLDERLPGWSPGGEGVRETVARFVAGTRRPSDACEYSDLGYMTLGWHLEARLGAPLAELHAAAGLPGRFGASSSNAARAMPTGEDPRRGRVPLGEVHDTNCWALGGVAAHAGLFATAEEVGRWAVELLAESARSTPLGAAIRDFWHTRHRKDGATWVLGWDTPSAGASSAGSRVGADAVGHLGFTGTSVWIDRTSGTVAVLLTNRVALPNTSERIKKFRPGLHDLAFDAAT